ncbi:hypothetical protein HMPREF1624_06156 [Sporothrix schenckii ATCC 58251]|uniref:C2H2-type domain-containing protein n=1 Tax=Sporothrix schenckii (strain ATCC 58251 / de Perez 2211183) TaxID=1391915 RepID=U7PTC8_SPOS1|nr:hypothetical protein HMPREF1624_06156 [Sporothrix schenckii ATCC 58251]
MSSYPFPDLPSEFAETTDDLDNLQPGTPTGSSLLFSPPMLHNTASSPALNNADTPAESVALSIHYQSSDYSEFDVDNAGDDNYFNAIFGTTGGNAPSFLAEDAGNFDPFGAAAAAASLADTNAQTYTTPEPIFNDIKAYPISPDQTPSLNAPASPSNAASSSAAAQKATSRSIAAVPSFDGLVSPQQLTKVPAATATRTTAVPQLQTFVSDAATQLTPDTTSSGGSLGNNDRGSLSTEGGATATTAPPMSNQNPHVTVSLWGKDSALHEESYLSSSEIKTERAGSNAGDSPLLAQADGAAQSTRRGIDPSNRPSTEILTNINDDAEARKVEKQNAAVSQWLDSAAGGEPDIQGPPPGPEGAFEGVSTREVDLGGETQNVEQPGRTYFTGNGGPVTATDYEIMLKSSIWENGPSVLPIAQGAVRNQPETSQAAIERFERMYHDNASIVSRAATWGTRRRSLPSIADIEGVTSGNFLKKLAINRGEPARRPSILDNLRTLVRKPSTSQQLKRSRGIPDDDASSYFADHSSPADDSRRDSTKSTSTLGLPPRTQSWGKSKQPIPSINTALVSMGSNMASVGATHTRNGSISRPHAGSGSLSPPLTSPKSPLLKVGNSLRRPRSKSDTKGTLDNPHPNLVRMLKKTGGPPIAALATANATPMFHGPTSVPATGVPTSAAAPTPAPAPATAPTPIKIPATRVAVADPDDEDDEDDEAFDDGDLKAESDELIDNITPDFNGFRELVLGLNPMLVDVNTYLVDRIAHQQIVRYKGLLNSRVKHLGQVKGQLCSSGPLCIAQGGVAVLIDSKGAPRSIDPLSATYDGEDADDVTSPLDGAINAESFPKYIPMPPTTTLPAEFECQLCFQNRRVQKPSDWTKHVHEDVQPFTCTWDRCRDPKIFKRKADWVRHENEGHRHLEWWTCDVEECRHTCYRRDNFLQHLVREHKFNEPKHKTKAAIKKSGAPDPTWQRVEQCHAETTARPQDEPCRFCAKTFPTWKKLTVHLAKHMEHISLPLLRLVERKEVEADTLISPVQDPPPRTFAPTVAYPATADAHQGELSRLSPNMMATGQVPGAGLHHHHLGQQLGGFGQPSAHDPNAYMYPAVTQVQYQQPAYYGQTPQQFVAAGVLPSQMQSLDAATLDMQPGFAGAQSYGGQLPVTTGGYLDPAGNQYIADPVSMIDSSGFSTFSDANALGLHAPIAGGQLQYDASIDPSVGSGEHYTPQGSVSPFHHSPHQPQGQFYGH